METQLLRDSQVYPGKEVLMEVLGNSYATYHELITLLVSEKYRFDFQWNYYKDGKAWLCKVSYKKKTVFWLSAWDSFFKTGFFFTEKNVSSILTLDVDELIKETFSNGKHIGKLIPLILNVARKEQIKDVLTIIDYKIKT
ncbi:MAG: DUF3788 family protein [Paludibacter sp.]|nr:DUF3788 family protein [Paludibacter sp.]